jgi:hypothetical protein
MPTIRKASNTQNTVARLRKRPEVTPSCEKAAGMLFRGQDEMPKDIPRKIDDYDHSIEMVDRADQHRPHNPGVRPVRRGGWHMVWLFMFNVILRSSYFLSSVDSQEPFRVQLYQRLPQAGTSARKRKWVDSGPELPLFQQTM